MNRVLLAALICSSAAFAATDVSGVWSGTISGPIYLTLKQDGNKLSGSAGQTRTDVLLTFDNGQVDGDHVTVAVGPFQLDLRVEGDRMTGEAKRGQESVRVFMKRVDDRAKRSPSDPLPSFEVASVKPAPPPSPNGYNSSMRMDPGRLTCTNVSLRKLIVNGYGVRNYQVSGPDWLDSELYDITARLPADTPAEDLFLMLQNLLAERFKLAIHREQKEMPVYALVVKTAGKLKPVEFAGGSTSSSPGKIEAKSVPMRNLAEVLSRMLDRPVVDATELKAMFTFTLEWTPEARAASSVPPDPSKGPAPIDSAVGPSLFTALQDQLGLKLESRKAPIDLIVVDHAEKAPTGN